MQIEFSDCSDSRADTDTRQIDRQTDRTMSQIDRLTDTAYLICSYASGS